MSQSSRFPSCQLKLRPEQPYLKTVNSFCHPALLMHRSRSSDFCLMRLCASQDDEHQFDQLTIIVSGLVILQLLFVKSNNIVTNISELRCGKLVSEGIFISFLVNR